METQITIGKGLRTFVRKLTARYNHLSELMANYSDYEDYDKFAQDRAVWREIENQLLDLEQLIPQAKLVWVGMDPGWSVVYMQFEEAVSSETD